MRPSEPRVRGPLDFNVLSKNIMKVPYPKPVTLSDPYFDWHGSESKIEKVISAKPEELGHEAYWMIFYQNLPAANYQEGCFYVPHFLNYYSRCADFESPNLEGFFWFIDHFREDFERDSLLDPILDRVWKIFLDRIKSFKIHRLTDEELVRYKICESYREIAPGSQTVNELLDCFTSWKVFDPIIVLMKNYFSTVSTHEKSFWYRECAFHTRIWLWVDSEPIDRRQNLFDFFHRLELFSAHNSNIMHGSKIHQGYFQYNRRLSPT